MSKARTRPYGLAIVGAGIIGANIAYRAATAGLDCLVLDQSVPGNGASRPSVGLSLPYGRSPLVRQYADFSRSFYDQLRTEYRWDLDAVGVCGAQHFDEVGERFCSPITDDHRLQRREVAHVAGFEISAGREQAYFRIPACHRALPYRIAEQLLAESNATVWEGVRVEKLVLKKSGKELLLADGRSINASTVVVATGPWLPQSLALVGAKANGVRVKKVVAFNIDVEPIDSAPLVYFFDEDAFLVPDRQHGRWLFSITSEAWDVTPDVSSLAISPADRSAALTILDWYAPALKSKMNSGRVFCDAYTTDRVPMVQTVADRTVACGAANGSGYRLAPGLAEHAVRLALSL